MPLFDVLLSAALDGASKVTLAQDYSFRLSFECGRCREIGDTYVVIGFNDIEAVPGGRGGASAVVACKFCKAQYSADLLSTPDTGVLTSEDKGPVRIGQLEVRGAVPIAAQLGPGFIVHGASGVSWPADLSSDDFAEYDDDAGASVTVSECKLHVVPALTKKQR